MPDRPELMAIGDSIYNGTRSLTTNAEVARLSVPAQVARAFGWDFKSPAYPFDVLFNLEALFRANAFNLDTLKASVVANAHGWLDRAHWADDDCYDNIAIAQSSGSRPPLDADSLLTDIPSLLDIDNLLIDLIVAFIWAAARPSVWTRIPSGLSLLAGKGSTLPLSLIVSGLPLRSTVLPTATRIQPSLMQYSSTLVFSSPSNLMPTPFWRSASS